MFEVFASGSLTDEVYVLDDVSGKRIAIAPRELKERYRRATSRATASEREAPRRDVAACPSEPRSAAGRGSRPREA